MSILQRIRSILNVGQPETASTDGTRTSEADAGDLEERPTGPPLDGDVVQQGDLELNSPDFDEGGRLPDWTGYANGNDNPSLEISGVPGDAESLLLVVDDPDAEPVVGHVYDHWLVWDVDPDQGEIPRGWDAEADDATVGYNDYGEAAWGGPAPPEGRHTYRVKLLALADELQAPPEARKSRLGSMIAMQSTVLASTQLAGTYDAEQGTIF